MKKIGVFSFLVKKNRQNERSYLKNVNKVTFEHYLPVVSELIILRVCVSSLILT